MALKEFWQNVRRTTRLYQSGVQTPDVQPVTREELEQEYLASEHWLTTRSVDGYVPSEFDFLPETEKDKLSGNVEAFRSYATWAHKPQLWNRNLLDQILKLGEQGGVLVPTETGNQSSSTAVANLSESERSAIWKGLLNLARPKFVESALALEFHRFRDANAFRIGKLIEQALSAKRPTELVELRFHTGDDWTGAPGIWIWAFLSREATRTDESLKEATHRIRPLVQDAARDVAPELFPYIAFRTVPEPVEAAA